MSNSWSAKVSNDVAFRRASGRRSYNSLRQGQAWWRRGQIIHEWNSCNLYRGGGGDLFDWGAQAALARKLGVSRSTISRDIAKIKEELQRDRCPTCDELVRVERLRRMEAAGRVRLIKPKKPVKPARDISHWFDSDLEDKLAEYQRYQAEAETPHGPPKTVGRLPEFHWDQPPGHECGGPAPEAPGVETGMEESEPKAETPAEGPWNFAPGAFDV